MPHHFLLRNAKEWAAAFLWHEQDPHQAVEADAPSQYAHFCRARWMGLNPFGSSFQANEGFNPIVSTANGICPVDAAMCKGVSANGSSSLCSKSWTSSQIKV